MDFNFFPPTSYEDLISYAPFWRTLKKKKISQYDLVNKLEISSSMVQKLRKDKPLTLKSIAMICARLGVPPTDVFEFCIDDDKHGSLYHR
ncbi:putative transcriptional regulator [Lachnospiraceae bacterium JC7]|nr:putative transcriptional regulator [Lachnospiraceae bacterium JC7]